MATWIFSFEWLSGCTEVPASDPARLFTPLHKDPGRLQQDSGGQDELPVISNTAILEHTISCSSFEFPGHGSLPLLSPSRVDFSSGNLYEVTPQVFCSSNELGGERNKSSETCKINFANFYLKRSDPPLQSTQICCTFRKLRLSNKQLRDTHARTHARTR